MVPISATLTTWRHTVQDALYRGTISAHEHVHENDAYRFKSMDVSENGLQSVNDKS